MTHIDIILTLLTFESSHDFSVSSIDSLSPFVYWKRFHWELASPSFFATHFLYRVIRLALWQLKVHRVRSPSVFLPRYWRLCGSQPRRPVKAGRAFLSESLCVEFSPLSPLSIPSSKPCPVLPSCEGSMFWSHLAHLPLLSTPGLCVLIWFPSALVTIKMLHTDAHNNNK